MKHLKNQLFFILLMAIIWQFIYESEFVSPLLFPSLVEVFKQLWNGFVNENLLSISGYSLGLILKGIVIGSAIGFILSAISLLVKPFKSIFQTLITICDPLPGIALLPIAILWFGIGENTILFILVYSVLWPMGRSIMDGFNTIPSIHIEVGKNIGLSNAAIIPGVYIPSSLPYLISGLKTGWARAWRTLIGSEMIFGVSGSEGGLGWYIFTKRYQLETGSVFASLLLIMIIGIIVEYLIFGLLEKKTVKKWGMQR